MTAVLIRGEGIAGSCCAHLLVDSGIDIAVEKLRRPMVPAVMLSETTQKLLRDVFTRDDLFDGLPAIRKRVVAWGQDSKPRTLPHSAVVVSEQELLERVQQRLSGTEYSKTDEPAWTIFASTPSLAPSTEHRVGSSVAAASMVRLRAGCDTATCWIESLEGGWLFLLPSGKETGWLLSVGGSVQSLLEASRLIASRILELNTSRGAFPSHPRVALPVAGPRWLACGTAALGFDPLCGDGVGNAVREAILGAAVVRAALGGADTKSLIDDYQTRLLGGFKRHLDLCREFYKSGRSGPWWDSQVEDLQRGSVWCSQQLSGKASFQYRLNGFTLEPVS